MKNLILNEFSCISKEFENFLKFFCHQYTQDNLENLKKIFQIKKKVLLS
jgi:hypothetical protein